MRRLLPAGAQVNYRSSDDWTLLIYAATNGGEEGVTLLIEVDGISRENESCHGKTVLLQARNYGYLAAL